MNKYLIKLADHLDKKGLHKEADYVDWIIKESAKKKKKKFPDHSGDGKVTKKDILMEIGVLDKDGNPTGKKSKKSKPEESKSKNKK